MVEERKAQPPSARTSRTKRLVAILEANRLSPRARPEPIEVKQGELKHAEIRTVNDKLCGILRRQTNDLHTMLACEQRAGSFALFAQTMRLSAIFYPMCEERQGEPWAIPDRGGHFCGAQAC
jgi:hypothetical protein